MKKFIFGGIAIVAIAVVTAFSVNLKSNEYGLSDVGLSNAEALANMSAGYWMYHCGSSQGTQCQSTQTGPTCTSQSSCP